MDVVAVELHMVVVHEYSQVLLAAAQEAYSKGPVGEEWVGFGALFVVVYLLFVPLMGSYHMDQSSYGPGN